MTNKTQNWQEFSETVVDHLENYVVPQYGDDGDDPATEYTAEDCFKQAERYIKRRNSNGREGQELRDIKKAAHWLSMAYGRLVAEGKTDSIGGANATR